MWFKLVNANFTTNLGTMSSLSNSWGITWSVSGGIVKTSCPGSVTKGGTLNATLTLNSGASLTSITSSSGTLTKTVSGTTVTVKVTGISANCTITVVATGGASTPVNPPSSGTPITTGSLAGAYLFEQSGYVSNNYTDGVCVDTVYYIYDLIPVQPNTAYRLQYGRAAFFLSSTKQQIGSRVNLTSGYDNWTFTTPSNCSYISVAFKYTEAAASTIVLESANLGQWVVKSTTLIKNTGATYTEGYGWDSTSYKPKASEGFYSYAEIPVKASTRYQVANARSAWFLKSDKTAISRINITKDITDFIFETPENTAYLSTCWQHAEKNKDEASIVEYEYVATT